MTTTIDSSTMLHTMSEMPWAMYPAALDRMAHAASAGPVDMDALPPARQASRSGSIAVLPIYGVIRQKGPTFTDLLFEDGGTSTEAFGKVFRQMIADPDVKAIVFDINSPGGSVYGTQELATEILKARGSKPIIAVVNSFGASAAYWIASAADEIVITPSGETGSIGVWLLHIDWSEWAKQKGLKFTYISAGKYKVEGNEDEPLSEEARAFLQEGVNEYYDAFVGGVAKGRGTSASAVRSGYGEGRVFGAKRALSMGMVDRIATLQETLKRLGGNSAGVGADHVGIAQVMGEFVETGASVVDIAPEDAAEVGDDAPPESKGESLDIRRRRLELAR